jgi:hypothetical protein
VRFFNISAEGISRESSPETGYCPAQRRKRQRAATQSLGFWIVWQAISSGCNSNRGAWRCYRFRWFRPQGCWVRGLARNRWTRRSRSMLEWSAATPAVQIPAPVRLPPGPDIDWLTLTIARVAARAPIRGKGAALGGHFQSRHFVRDSSLIIVERQLWDQGTLDLVMVLKKDDKAFCREVEGRRASRLPPPRGTPSRRQGRA